MRQRISYGVKLHVKRASQKREETVDRPYDELQQIILEGTTSFPERGTWERGIEDELESYGHP